MKKAWIYFFVTLFFNIIFRVISRLSVDFSEWYATSVYPVIVTIFGFLSGLFPFSVIEIVLILLIIAAFTGVITLIIAKIKKKRIGKRFALKAVSVSLCVLSTIAMSYLFACEINYQRHPFSKYSGLLVSKYTEHELRAVIDEIIDVLEDACLNIQTTESGQFYLDESKINEVSRNSMKKLAETYSCLDTNYPRPKPILLSEILLTRTLTCGVYSPFTIEANYNNHMPDSEKPFTICHELSHMNGFMREDEANFISFLACRESKDWDFIYSGYSRALVYCINAYYGIVSEDVYFDMHDNIPLQVRKELQLTNEYWRPYRNTVISEVSEVINDTYLKVNSQTDGTKSYGRLVDLLIADYLSRNAGY